MKCTKNLTMPLFNRRIEHEEKGEERRLYEEVIICTSWYDVTFYTTDGEQSPPAGCPKIVLDHMCIYNVYIYSQPHLIGTWLIGSSGSDQDFSPDKTLLWQTSRLLVCHNNGYQVWNLDHFLNSQLTRFRLSGVDCIYVRMTMLK